MSQTRTIVKAQTSRKSKRQRTVLKPKVPEPEDVLETVQSSSSQSPNSTYDADYQRLSNNLPLEVYEIIILNHLESRTDLENVSKATPVLGSILHTKRRLWLFEPIYPFIMNQLSYKANLDLRLVCKRWRNAVNKHFEYFPSHRPLVDRGEDWSPYNDGAYVRPHFHVSFQSKEQIDIFVQKVDSFENTSGKSDINPFIGRSVLVSASLRDNLPEAEIKEFWERVKFLIEKFGKHIYNLEIYWNRGPLEFYRVLDSIIQSSPNLRFLKLSGYITGHDILDDYLKELRQEMANNPLVQLDNLEYIGLDMSGFPKPLMRMLSATYFRQLKVLSTPYHDWRSSINRGMPKLEQIELRKASCGQTILREIPGLLPAQNLTWMTIYLRPDYPTDLLEMGQLMKVIVKFPKLKTFELFFSDIFQQNQPAFMPITENEVETYKSKSVTTLQITSYPLLRFDFLLCFPKLKSLHIHMSNKDWTEYPELPVYARENEDKVFPIQETVQVHKYLYSKNGGGIRQSNIWNCLNDLERFRFDLRNWDDDGVLFTQCVTRKKYNMWKETNKIN